MDCHTRFEIRRHFHDESAVICPQCHSEMRRVFSPTTVIFKGSGFYTTDNGKNGSKPEEQGYS